MWKQRDLVMLPSNEKAMLCLSKKGSLQYLRDSSALNPNNHFEGVYQHLHILSDEIIRNLDFVCDGNCLRVASSKIIEAQGLLNRRPWKKVIATTDDSLNYCSSCGDVGCHLCTGKDLFQIPTSFIEHFVEQYNKGNRISEVLVEYRDYSIPGGVKSYISRTNEVIDLTCKIVVNSDNTINIKPIKDSFSREEVVNLISNNLMSDIDMIYNGQAINYERLNKWINENL